MNAKPYTEEEMYYLRVGFKGDEPTERWRATVDSLQAELAEARAMVLARFKTLSPTAADLAQAREFIEPYERGRVVGRKEGIEQAVEITDKEAAASRRREEETDGNQHWGLASSAAERIARALRALSSPASGSGGSPPTKWDEKRCRVCGWTLAVLREDGCALMKSGIPDCSMRPMPTKMADGSGDAHEVLTRLHSGEQGRDGREGGGLGVASDRVLDASPQAPSPATLPTADSSASPEGAGSPQEIWLCEDCGKQFEQEIFSHGSGRDDGYGNEVECGPITKMSGKSPKPEGKEMA